MVVLGGGAAIFHERGTPVPVRVKEGREVARLRRSARSPRERDGQISSDRSDELLVYLTQNIFKVVLQKSPPFSNPSTYPFQLLMQRVSGRICERIDFCKTTC